MEEKCRKIGATHILTKLMKTVSQIKDSSSGVRDIADQGKVVDLTRTRVSPSLRVTLGKCAVCRGKHMNEDDLQRWLSSKWKTRIRWWVGCLHGGNYLVKFPNNQWREEALLNKDSSKAFWSEWSSETVTTPAVHGNQIWVDLMGIPLDLWDTETLTAIISTVGRLTEVHRDTLTGHNLEVAKVKIEQMEGSPIPSQLKIRCVDGDFWVEIRPWKQVQGKLSWVEVVKNTEESQQGTVRVQKEIEEGEKDRSPQGRTVAQKKPEVIPREKDSGKRSKDKQTYKEGSDMEENNGVGPTEIAYMGENEDDLVRIKDLKKVKKIWDWVEGTIEEKFNEEFMGSPDPCSIWTLTGR